MTGEVHLFYKNGLIRSHTILHLRSSDYGCTERLEKNDIKRIRPWQDPLIKQDYALYSP